MLFLVHPTENNSGFTLIELLMVVSIIAVLSSFLIPGFSNYIDKQNVLQGQEILKSDLRTAQNKALTGVGSSIGTAFWGVKVIGNNAADYLYFSSTAASGPVCDGIDASTAGVEKTQNLNGNVVVRDSNNACVFFSIRNGDATIVNNAGSDTLKVAHVDEAPCYGVQINSAGMIKGVKLCE